MVDEYNSLELKIQAKTQPLRVCVIGLGGGGFHWEAQKIIQLVKRPLELILVFAGPKGGLIYWTSKDLIRASYILPSPSLMGDNLPRKCFRLLYNGFQALLIVINEQPDVILAVGSAQAIPFAIAGRILGTPLWFMESLTRISGPSRTGYWIYRLGLAVRFYYYWRDLARHYGGGYSMEKPQR